MRISDWSSDVCSSDLDRGANGFRPAGAEIFDPRDPDERQPERDPHRRAASTHPDLVHVRGEPCRIDLFVSDLRIRQRLVICLDPRVFRTLVPAPTQPAAPHSQMPAPNFVTFPQPVSYFLV